MVHGETDHATWYNALAVRLCSLGCQALAMDTQGFGQSDGARGYFESFEEVKDDFIGCMSCLTSLFLILFFMNVVVIQHTIHLKNC